LRECGGFGAAGGRLRGCLPRSLLSLGRYAALRGWWRFGGCGGVGAAGAFAGAFFARCSRSGVTPRYGAERLTLTGHQPLLSPSIFLLTSKLDAFLGFDALVFEGVFDDFHFGDGVGEVDEGLGGVAAGDDGVLHVGAGL